MMMRMTVKKLQRASASSVSLATIPGDEVREGGR